ncbi:glycosyltransferase [Lunatibacter salilacus]|uniref:glycosyltransferase n=1 Tax=Lunatibacter salilacus TaxID=2483804 RepID=UPI00131B876B|nr:glycosyltransferase [Lunatibacter salilacus]
MNLAPIAVFCFKRVDTLEKCIELLKANPLFSKSDLIIFSDGPKKPEDVKKVEAVRGFISSIDGCKSVRLVEHKVNQGLANSIINGVSVVLQEFGRVIVLEDDLIVSSNFLSYMNKGLEYYAKDTQIQSISGFSPSIKIPNNYLGDIYFSPRSTSWGWATWIDRWTGVDWAMKDFEKFSKNPLQIREFNRYGNNFYSLLQKQYSGKIDSWAIRWCFDQFKKKRYSVFPTQSKVMNIGFGPEATHTAIKLDTFDSSFDRSDKHAFEFLESKVGYNKSILKLIRAHYSFFSRVRAKIKSILFHEDIDSSQ